MDCQRQGRLPLAMESVKQAVDLSDNSLTTCGRILELIVRYI